MKDHISVYITKEDFLGTNYMDPRNCALATALKRNGHKLTDGGVGSDDAGIDYEEYGIVEHHEIFAKYGEALNGTIREGLEVNLLRI